MQNAIASSSKHVIRTVPVPGYNHYLPPLRKLIVDFNEKAPSQQGIRSFIRKPLVDLAKRHPEVEILVRKVKQGRAAVLRGHYITGRDKVICVNKLEVNEIENKANLLLNSSGSKIKHLKNLQLELGPGNEAGGARGMWSPIHVSEEARYKI